MRSPALRMTVTVLAVGAITAAAYLVWTTHSRAAADVQAALAFEGTHAAALKEAYELRSAQQAYVAAGQNETFWFERVTMGGESLKATVAALKSTTASQAARGQLQEADAAIEDFEQIDRRARSYAAGGQRLLASDLIFSDGLEAAGRIVSALEKSAAAGITWRESVTAEASRQQLLAAAGAAAFGILALVLLTPVPPAPASVQETLVKAPPAAEQDLDFDLDRLLDTGTREAGGEGPRTETATAAPPPTMEIQHLAALCTDLARLSNTTALPEILERTAAALDASGLVLWISDPDGKELVAIAAHGYPDSMLARIGPLGADAENATSAAFRTGLLQTVSAAGGSAGAIAVPLVSPSGCRGVMSAEIRHDAEQQPARLAAASIIAAQLATLVGPPAARAQERGTAAL